MKAKKPKKAYSPLPLFAFLILMLLLLISIGFLMQWKDWANLPGNLLVLVVLNLNIILVLILIFTALRNLIKLYFERKKNVLGARFRTRLVFAFVSLSLIPAILLFIVASNLINRSIEGWFNVHNEEYLKRALRIAQVQYTASIGKAFSDARSIGKVVARQGLDDQANTTGLQAIIKESMNESAMEGLKLINARGKEILDIRNVSVKKGHFTGPLNELIEKGLKGKEYSIIERSGEGHLIESVVPVHSMDNQTIIGVILFNYYDPYGLMDEITYIKNAYEEYQRRKVFKRPLKITYQTTFILITLLIIFSAIWFGFYLARGITVPIQKLAEGTKEIAAGNLDFKVEVTAKDEIGMLVESFNQMTEDLNRALTGLKQSNQELDRRRRHIETILANITSGVVTLDDNGLVTTINPAAERILTLHAPKILRKPFAAVMEKNPLQPLKELIDRAIIGKRGEIYEENAQIHLHGQTKTLLVNIVSLSASGEEKGLLVVFDDLTQLMKAQKLATWQEVARQLAHEIKNPLTPIQLSAQRLWKRFQDLKGGERAIMQECTDTIIQEVQGLKTLIDAFSQFARMPEPEPKPEDLGMLIAQTVSMFAQSHPDCALEFKNDVQLPSVMMDRDQIKRAIINLLDNAYDAIVNERTIKVLASFDPGEGYASVQIVDWGTGIPPEDRERLIEPYFSRKKGGTGLGLAIVQRIIADHHGRLLIEENHPQGTKVTFSLPQA